MTQLSTVAPAPPPAGPPSGAAARTLATALAPMVWGTTYVVTTELLPEGHPMFAGLMRALPAGLIALAVTRTLPSGSWWWKVPVLGILNIGIFFPLLFIAAEHLPGGVAATLGATQPLMVAVLAVVVLRERLSGWRLGWGISGAVGVAAVVLGPGARLDATGVVAGVVGAASMAMGVVLSKRWGRPDGVGPTAYAGWLLTAGGLFLLPLTAVVEGAPPAIDAHAVGGYLWLGLVGGLMAYVLYFRGIGTLPVTAVALLGLMSPIVAAGLGLALGETLNGLQIAGFALALTAVVAGQLAPPGRPGADPVRAVVTPARSA